MKLHERFGDPGFHTSIATTFCIDFETYEGVALPRLRSAGCNNNLVLMDERMMIHSLDTGSVLPSLAGRQYTLNGVKAPGVFHPKILLQLGRSAARVIVGSANLTAPGLGGNLEVIGVATAAPEGLPGNRIVASAWEYVSRFIDTSQDALAYQVDWMRRRTSWLFDQQPALTPERLPDGGAVMLLTGRGSAGIAERFLQLVGEDRAVRLVTISPYWDENLEALHNLSMNLDAQETVVLVGSSMSPFPAEQANRIKNIRFHDLGGLGKDRFVHAKLLVVSAPTEI